MRSKEPLISVIVPVYNGEKYLVRCLDSLKAQTARNVEFVLVNNGSTDGSEAILRSYVEKDSRFVLYCQENRGINGSRNRGLRESRGELIGFVDADDYIEPAMVETMARRLCESDADVAICDYDMTYVSKEKKHVLALRDEVADTADLTAAVLYLRYFGRDPVVWNKLYRKQLILEHKIEFEVGHGEDLLFHLRLMPYIQRVCVLPNDFYHYVQRRSSSAHSLTQLSAKDMTILNRFLETATLEQSVRELSFLAFANIFTGFMFSPHCIGRDVRYFKKQIQTFSTWPLFEAFCETIACTDDLAVLYREGAISIRFYHIEKIFFDMCRRHKDVLAAHFAWVCSKLIVLKKRKFLTGQFD